MEHPWRSSYTEKKASSIQQQPDFNQRPGTLRRGGGAATRRAFLPLCPGALAARGTLS